PKHCDRVARLLSEMPGVEVHHRSESKIVVVLEGPDSGVLGGRLAEIASFPGVLSANMVFEQIERISDLGE
ncbi:MAG: chaperone NapD, partial [Pseudolabrys sp.]